MNQPQKNTFVVAFSSSALFDTRVGDAIFQDRDEEAFIQHQIENEDVVFNDGAAMPIAKALLATKAILKDSPKVKLVLLSRNNPAASIRVMKSAAAYDLPIERASFVGGAQLDRLLAAEQVDLFLSRNEPDVRAALQQGVAAAKIVDCIGPVEIEENQLRVAFDFDAVLANDESERFGAGCSLPEYFKHEAELERIPLEPGPFAPVLQWMAKLQVALRANGTSFQIRTAIVTARNQSAMNRVILTMRHWKVRVDETHFLGADKKDAVLGAFRPHIFFDDQLKNVTGIVPSGHVLFGVKNQPIAEATPGVEPCLTKNPQEEEQSKLVEAAAAGLNDVTRITKKNFELQCRAIFRSYTPMARQSPVLDERFRLFTAQHSSRTSEERAKILEALKRYDLSDIQGHDPILNRELGDIVLKKLDTVVAEALAPKQQDLNLG
jgi:5'-nucleotidase